MKNYLKLVVGIIREGLIGVSATVGTVGGLYLMITSNSSNEAFIGCLLVFYGAVSTLMLLK